MNTVTEYLLRQRIAQLEAENEQLSINPSYGCLTRASLESKWVAGGSVIFGDVDDMHRLNGELGYEVVNTRIRTALNSLKVRVDTVLGCSWFSGDEFIWTLPTEDARAFADRIIAAFAAHGLSITLGISPASSDLSASVACASDLVQAAKERGGRGRVYTTEGV